MTACIECSSPKTKLYRGEDGHFRRECLDCGHVGGPYVSMQGKQRQDRESEREEEDESDSDQQPGLEEFQS